MSPKRGFSGEISPASPKNSEQAPLAAWLEEQLRSERKRMQLDLELRHCSLVSELGSRLQRLQPKEIAPETQPPTLQYGLEAKSPPPILECQSSQGQLLKSDTQMTGMSLPMELPGQISEEVRSDVRNDVQSEHSGELTEPPSPKFHLPRAGSMSSLAEEGAGRQSVKVSKDARLKGVQNMYSRRLGMTTKTLATKDMPAFAIKEEAPVQSWLGSAHPARMVRSDWFETTFCVLIVLNMIVMSFEVQFQGLDTGYELAFPNYDHSAEYLWPGASDVFRVSEWLFGIVFFIEIVIRVLGWTWWFPLDFWNWFDTGMVVLWVLGETWFQSMDERILRLARTARLFRLVRVIRKIHGFDSLYLMMTAMRGSVAVLFWSFILLLVAQLMIAFLLNQILSATYLMDQKIRLEDRQEVFAYFGTCSRAILSMFELTLGNWPVIARVLQDKVHEAYFIFSIAHKVTIGFAVIGVINGVFMQETFKVAGSDDKIMMRQRERERKLHTKKMKVLFEHADESGDGILDIEEFRQVMENPSVRTWLAAQDLHMNSPEASDQLFRLLDDGDAALTAQELVEGVARLKGPAKSMDLAVFSLEFRKFKEDVTKMAELAEKLASGDMPSASGLTLPPLTEPRSQRGSKQTSGRRSVL